MPRPRNGVWSWLAASGDYQAKLTADRMTDENFPISLKKGVPFNHHVDMKPAAIAPQPATLVINGGDPEATVSVDNAAIGELDEKGNGKFPGVAPGTHTIQLSKPGYGSNSYYGQVLIAGRQFELLGNKKLTALSGYARIVSVKPDDAIVTYTHGGETHRVTELNKITLPPGTYEFAADAPKFLRKTQEVKIEANHVKELAFDLQPVVKR